MIHRSTQLSLTPQPPNKPQTSNPNIQALVIHPAFAHASNKNTTQHNTTQQALVVRLVDRVLEEIQRGMEVEGGPRERDTQVRG